MRRRVFAPLLRVGPPLRGRRRPAARAARSYASPRRTGQAAAEHRVRALASPCAAARSSRAAAAGRSSTTVHSFWVIIVVLRLGQLLGRRGAVERVDENRRDGVVPRPIRSLLLALRPRLGLGAGLAPQDRVRLQERRAPVLRGGRVDVARRLYDGRVQDDALRRRVALDGRHDALVVAANIRDAAPPQTQRNDGVQVDGLAVVDLPRRAGVVAAGAPRVLEAPHGLLHLEGLGLFCRAAQRLRRLVDELLLVAHFALALFGLLLLCRLCCASLLDNVAYCCSVTLLRLHYPTRRLSSSAFKSLS